MNQFQVPEPVGGSAAGVTPPARVLIVEDDPLFRRFSTAALHEARHTRVHADAAATWADARRLLHATRYDCLLLDLGLPDVQGLATVQAALEAAPGTPVVVLTGEEDPHLADAALGAGVQDFLEKTNADAGSLERAIRHAMDRGRWAAELAAANRELEARNAELDDFAHVVSHDLKAPLRAIYYLVQEAEASLAAGDAAAARDGLTGIAPRVKRLFGMIDGVLQLSQAGRSPPLPAPVPVGRLVAEIVESLAVPPGFQVAVAPDLPTLLAERVALTQVFQNLLDNALKHHHRDAGRVEVAWRDLGARVEFTVADDGPGIPPPLRERAFKLFQTFRPDQERGGTGVGLALVRKLVEANGGQVRVEDRDGGGSCFRFTWPRVPPGPPQAQPDAPLLRS